MILDYSETTLDKGFFGINIHKSNPNKESYNVDKWSAGCQVFKKADDFDSFMDLCEAASFEWSNSFTYTLIESNDI